jgi:hypothetical protein
LVVRKSVLARFDFGLGQTFSSEAAAFDSARAFKAGYRRAERCAVVRAYKGDAAGTVVIAAEKPEPGHAPGGVPVDSTAAPKKSAEPKSSLTKTERRAARAARKKLALLDIIAMVRESTFQELTKLNREASDAALRREAFKEIRARQSHEASARIYLWKASGKRVVIKTHIDEFRR